MICTRVRGNCLTIDLSFTVLLFFFFVVVVVVVTGLYVPRNDTFVPPGRGEIVGSVGKGGKRNSYPLQAKQALDYISGGKRLTAK